MNPVSLKGLIIAMGTAVMLTAPTLSLSQTTSAAPVYQPPLRGTTAGGRIGGGTRGLGEQTVNLSVLAPEHLGLTVSAQPHLYWHVTNSVDVPAEITIVDKRSTDPLLELSVAPPIERGFHVVDLAHHGVRLEPGVQYEWFVALVVDPKQRSRDIVAGGEIELVSRARGFDGKLAAADGERRASVYAEAGIWYDAVDAVSQLVDRRPTDSVHRLHRAALLDQVGLAHPAEDDRRAAP